MEPEGSKGISAAEFEIHRLREVLNETSSKAYWAENELIEVMRIICGPESGEGDITRMMKIHAVRMMVEVNAEKYEELLAKITARPEQRSTK